MTACLCLGLLMCGQVASAQTTATPLSKWAWEQPQTTSPADAQALIYKYYAGANAGVVIAGETCVATVGQAQTHTCSVQIPPLAVGVYSVALTASNLGAEGPKSNLLQFTLVVVPATPANFRLIGLLKLKPLTLVSRRGLFHWKRQKLTGFAVPSHQ